MKLGHASATFEQSGYPATATIDGVAAKPEHGWAVLGGTGQDQAIYFELAEPLGGPGEKTLVFTLRQEAGGNRTLNRFRLSATTARGPVRAPAVRPAPKDVAEALKIPAAQRTAGQRTRVMDIFGSSLPRWLPNACASAS